MADFNGTAGDDDFKGTSGDDLMAGRLGDDTLQGLAGNDFLSGGGGDDVLNGGSGNDTLNGGAGTDQLLGGSGDDLIVISKGTDPTQDVIDGGSGFDTVSFSGFKHGVVVDLTNPTGFHMAGIEALIGSAFDDELRGQLNVAGYYDGGAGNDTLFGNHAHDTLAGGDGDDVIQQFYLRAVISGGDGNDFINSAGQSTVDGGAGDDTLQIFGSHNQVTGGDGADVFQFGPAVGNGDLIQDLADQDVIDLSAVDAVAGQAGNEAFVLVAGFDGHAGEAMLVYDSGADQTRLEMDTDGDAVANKTILISGDHTDFTNVVL